MYQWVCGVTSHDTEARINGPEFRLKAEKIAEEMARKGDKKYEDFKCSDGFITRWKHRFQMVVRRATGEKNSANPGAVENFLETTMTEIFNRFEFFRSSFDLARNITFSMFFRF